MSVAEIVVVRPGPLALIVDRGRFGYLAIGVSWCGAADLLALTVANRLTGNDASAAALEITFGGAIFSFTQRTRFALAGADCAASLDGTSIAAWASYEAPPGATLAFGAPRSGVRAIVAVHGGVDLPMVMGSRTTDLAASVGGLNGRPLAAGDRLPICAADEVPYAGPLRVKPPDWDREPARDVEVGVIPGAEFPLFSDEAQERFWSTRWRVSPQSSRMACVLEGEGLRAGRVPEMRSHAVVPGVIQVPPSGLPFVLLCDAQTTGGYPKMGVVAEADVWRLAQAEPGRYVRLKPISLAEAAAASWNIEAYLATVESAIASRALRA